VTRSRDVRPPVTFMTFAAPRGVFPNFAVPVFMARPFCRETLARFVYSLLVQTGRTKIGWARSSGFVVAFGMAAAAVPAPAQTMTGLVARANGPPGPSRFRMPTSEIPSPEAPRLGMFAVPVGQGVEIGLGRFQVLPLARPRTNVEVERSPMAVRPRHRGMPGLGVSLRF
jgi:hypothetical protein